MSSSRIRCVGIATSPLGGRGFLASRSLRSETDSFEWGTSFVTGCPEEIPPACASQGTASPERFPAKESGWRGKKAMRRSRNSASVMRRGVAILTALVSFRTLVCLIGWSPLRALAAIITQMQSFSLKRDPVHACSVPGTQTERSWKFPRNPFTERMLRPIETIADGTESDSGVSESLA